MHYLVIERFKPGALKAIYERFDRQGRLLPDGLHYVDSWVSADLAQCFQLMECDDESRMQEWIGHWEDLIDFEVIPVVSSAEARTLALERG